MATSSFDKEFVIRDDKAADVLIQLAKVSSTQTAVQTPNYRLVKKDELVKKSIKR
jgi:hypothetical protein